MDRSDNRTYVRPALFVDFDNIFTSLRERDQSAATAFATDPLRWVQWIEDQLGPVGPRGDNETPRVVLQRNCYLNPVAFSKYRSYFTRAGFRIVDCPPLTQQGKNSADIHMVLDALDVLTHPTYYDEVLVLSLDADFTPLFLRLRAHDRRVVMLGSGPAAAAMRHACDYVIPDDVFMNEALAAGPAAVPVSERVSPGASPAPEDAEPEPAPSAPDAADAGAGAASSFDDAELARLRQTVRARLRQLVAESPVPLSGSSAGKAIRDQLGPVIAASKWAGGGTFKGLILRLHDERLHWCQLDTGYVGDPRRHLMPADGADGWTASHGGQPVTVVELVTRVLDIPRLLCEQWGQLLEAVATVLDGPDGLSLAERERLATTRSGTLPPCTSYVMEGLRLGHYDLTAVRHDPVGLASCFSDSVTKLAEAAQMELSHSDAAVLRHWFSGGRTTLPAVSAPTAD